MAIIQIRVDEQLKEDSSKVFENIGLDMSTAIRMFLIKSVEWGTIPFPLATNKQREEFGRHIAEMQEISKRNGNDKMTLDEINEIIREVREERRKTNGQK